ncbi:MAG: hypothetical protein OSB62_00945 [Alphaproteobacteria bacterium]|nr:hypothetical protein [Alphaproteobacteria bacterium]
MKTVRIFAIGAVVSAFCWAQIGTLLNKGEMLPITQTPAYYAGMLESFDNKYDVRDRVGTWADREGRKLRMTATKNMNEVGAYLSSFTVWNAAAEEVDGKESGGETFTRKVTESTAIEKSLRPNMRPWTELAPMTSKRPEARPDNLAQDFAIRKAIAEAGE